jgi:hypothetical protein
MGRGSIYYGEGARYTIGTGVKIPWVRIRYDMDRGFDIPWVGVQNTMEWSFDIPCIWGSKYHG